MVKYNFTQKLQRKEVVIGPFSKTSDPSMIEAMGFAGFDFVILDLEHGPNSINQAQNLIRAAEISGIFPIIRISSLDASQIGRALDIGAAGIQIPQITTEKEAERAVSFSKFGPAGTRGVCRFVRAANYSSLDRFLYFDQSNDSFVILQLEGTDALNNLEDIVSVPGIDIVFIGPYDLSQSLGVTGRINEPVVIEKVRYIVDVCRSRNIVVGIFADEIEQAKYWMRLGVRYIAYSVDVGLITDISRKVMIEISQ